jgi:RNA polymerase sigma-70 factor (ECF subfamily)
MRLLRAGPPAWHRDLADEFFLAAGRKEALTMRRDRRKHVALSEGFGGVLLSAESLPDYHAEQCELRALLERSIAGLPTRCREVLLRIGTGRVTRAEVAEELGISLGAVEKQITRGYRLLRQTLPPEIAEPF